MELKMLVIDVDGTLTDGKLYMGVDGEFMKVFNVKDGLQIKKLILLGIIPVILTGRNSIIVEKRAVELGILNVYQGVENKLHKLLQIQEMYTLDKSEIAYIGDDENDLECIDYCGVTACPSDANEKIISLVDYICKAAGGQGCVAEFINILIQSKIHSN